MQAEKRNGIILYPGRPRGPLRIENTFTKRSLKLNPQRFFNIYDLILEIRGYSQKKPDENKTIQQNCKTINTQKKKTLRNKRHEIFAHCKLLF